MNRYDQQRVYAKERAEIIKNGWYLTTNWSLLVLCACFLQAISTKAVVLTDWRAVAAHFIGIAVITAFAGPMLGFGHAAIKWLVRKYQVLNF